MIDTKAQATALPFTALYFGCINLTSRLCVSVWMWKAKNDVRARAVIDTPRWPWPMPTWTCSQNHTCNHIDIHNTQTVKGITRPEVTKNRGRDATSAEAMTPWYRATVPAELESRPSRTEYTRTEAHGVGVVQWTCVPEAQA